MWESWKAVPLEVKEVVLHELSHHYKLSNLDANQMQYINDLCSDRFTQWKSNLHKHYELYDGPKVALAVVCPIEGCKFPEIDMFKEVYIWFGDELTEQLHTVLEEVASHLPLETPIKEVFPPEDAGFQIMTNSLDQTLGHRPRNVHRGHGKARLLDPSASSSRQRTEEEWIAAQQSQIATQNNWMNQIRHALQISGIQM
ncbi:hypothetical protein D8674_011850 [Pyrus ussuriensis x Pyrus communis]|uniref:Uncharacterized protein n=1 Tax=Pyrus ussuriensis x Pyrus communis TaxID=2448454 RepID=A0A5N5G5G8_9ROSA|nr:hypothetical protein D8674_011850 [Pyrus ussuriensis x Pyrus communis]